MLLRVMVAHSCAPRSVIFMLTILPCMLSYSDEAEVTASPSRAASPLRATSSQYESVRFSPLAFLSTFPFSSVRGNSAGFTLHARVRSEGRVLLASSLFMIESTRGLFDGVTMPTTGLPLRCTPPSRAKRLTRFTVSWAAYCDAKFWRSPRISLQLQTSKNSRFALDFRRSVTRSGSFTPGSSRRI